MYIKCFIFRIIQLFFRSVVLFLIIVFISDAWFIENYSKTDV